MTEIERLARALDDVDIILARNDFKEIVFNAAGIVRAILQAMREPSEEMLTEGHTAASHFLDYTGGRAEFAIAWQAMIDHILSEAP